MRFNHTKNQTWLIEFDSFFPSDATSYVVHPKYYISGDYDSEDAVGFFYVRYGFYLNGIWIYGGNGTVDINFPGGLGFSRWEPPADELYRFSNATPKDSGNTFETRLTFGVVMFQFGEGEIDIVAGPLLLYAKKSSDPTVLLTWLMIPLISGILALPAAYSIEFLSGRLSENGAHDRKGHKR